MSSYVGWAINPKNNKIEQAYFIDDYYGSHHYGIQFMDKSIYPEEEITIPDDKDIPIIPPEQVLDWPSPTTVVLPKVETVTKLNLGGGSLDYEGFINVDLQVKTNLKEGMLNHDLKKPLPFTDNSVDEIIAVHIIESFYAWEFPDILADWFRVLKPGGIFTVEFTVLSKTINLYQNAKNQQEKDWGRWGLHGNQSEPINPITLHHYVYEITELKDLLEEIGFKIKGSGTEGVEHVPERDLRIICVKPEVKEVGVINFTEVTEFTK